MVVYRMWKQQRNLNSLKNTKNNNFKWNYHSDKDEQFNSKWDTLWLLKMTPHKQENPILGYNETSFKALNKVIMYLMTKLFFSFSKY